MTSNCDLAESVLNISPYLRVFASSNAASVSSNTKNGGGFTCERANISAIDVSDLSPPDNISRPLIFLRGKLTSTSIPHSLSPAFFPFSSSSFSYSISSPSMKIFSGLPSSITPSLAEPPLNNVVKKFVNSLFTSIKPSLNLVSRVLVKSRISFSSDSMLAVKSASSVLKCSSRALVSSNSRITSVPNPPASSALILSCSLFLRKSCWVSLVPEARPPDLPEASPPCPRGSANTFFIVSIPISCASREKNSCSRLYCSSCNFNLSISPRNCVSFARNSYETFSASRKASSSSV